jgi:Leucine-rich repeat (LRR) protein
MRYACTELQAEGQMLCDIASGIPYLTSTGIGWNSGPSCSSATQYTSGQPEWCSWQFITCNQDTFVVEYISVHDCSGGGGPGTISPSVWNLTHLSSLSILNCPLTGTIPSISSSLNITSMGGLTISGTGIVGTIPSAIGTAFPALATLDLSHNHLNGSIPSQLGNLKSLGSFDLSFNNLTSTIPSSLSSLVNLGLMKLYSNQLTGTVPSGFSALTNIAEFSVNNNYLYGPLPASFASFGSITSSFFEGKSRLSRWSPAGICNAYTSKCAPYYFM